MLLEEGVCQCVLLAKLLAFALLPSVFRGQICLLLQVFLDFLLLHSSPLKYADDTTLMAENEEPLDEGERGE